MSAGRIALKQTVINRPRKTYDVGRDGPGTLAFADRVLHEKYSAAVLVKISLRPGDNTDMLEALGLIPTTYTDERAPIVMGTATCPTCGWVSAEGRNPRIALTGHSRRHKTVTA